MQCHKPAFIHLYTPVHMCIQVYTPVHTLYTPYTHLIHNNSKIYEKKIKILLSTNNHT